MKFCLTNLEYDLLVEISLLNGLHVTVVKNGSVTYLELTGSQVREIVKRLFDNLWNDLLTHEEKRILSFLGWRLTDKCL